MRKKTHIISCIFLILLALPQVLLIALQLWQWHAWHEAMERLEKESLQTIVVDAEALTWENNKEVRIDGRMFDIKSCTVEKEKYILTGLFDEKETAIKNLLSKQTSDPNSSIIRLLLLVQSFITALLLVSFLYLPSFKKRISLFKNYYPFYCKELSTPPPKPLFVFS